MTNTIITNRDLYRTITTALKARTNRAGSLERYLLAVMRLLDGAGSAAPMSGDELAEILLCAFDAAPADVGDNALRAVAADAGEPSWRRQLARQILDLREMDLAGTLKNEYRYFGVDAPSGARWYNFDPHTFVECGITGAFGGWCDGDDTGRILVNGPVATIGQDGEITSVNPVDIEEPIYALGGLTGDALAEFLWAGQCYE